MKKYTFKKDNWTTMIWADSLFTASDMAGTGWGLFMISK